MRDEEKRKEHPGWAVRFLDGTWLGGPHGWYQYDDAFYADIYESEKEAHNCYEISGFKDAYEVVLAWEPLCESLRVEILSLRKVNKIGTSELMQVEWDLESVFNTIKKWNKG